ncbi:MAG: bifunctional 4-hydroxy-2-oxoglutarate aldolase/2-dehydro-3-deoxy-phosphogluconate aldolase [Pseudomonadota bacterium]
MSQDRSAPLRDMLTSVSVVPVLVMDDIETAVPLAGALVEGGLNVFEITLRTEAALACITAVRAALPDAVVGVGTLRSAEDVAASVRAGAAFGVSPGAPDPLLDACLAENLPLLPGAATPTEIMRLAMRGYTLQKLFPAEAVGGIPLLKSLASPLQGIMFCPTGGITADTARDYLDLPNVICVGGSWITPRDLVAARDYDAITELARASAASAAVA